MTRKGHLKVVYDDDFYQGLRRRIRDWGEGGGRGRRFLDFILLAPDLLHLMARLVVDQRVPLKSKAKLGVAIAYFVSPIDLLPEAVLGPIGYLDDVALAAWVIDDLLKSAGPELVLEHWAGDQDLIEAVARITAAANEILGAGLVRRLKRVLDDQRFGPLVLAEREAVHDLPPGGDE